MPHTSSLDFFGNGGGNASIVRVPICDGYCISSFLSLFVAISKIAECVVSQCLRVM